MSLKGLSQGTMAEERMCLLTGCRTQRAVSQTLADLLASCVATSREVWKVGVQSADYSELSQGPAERHPECPASLQAAT